jgi:hypothetical protein
MYASAVIGDADVLAMSKPIIVVCVLEPTVTTVAADVPTSLLTYEVKVFAILVPYPKAIAIATAVPA